MTRILRLYAAAVAFGWLAGWCWAWWRFSKPHQFEHPFDRHLDGTIAGRHP